MKPLRKAISSKQAIFRPWRCSSTRTKSPASSSDAWVPVSSQAWPRPSRSTSSASCFRQGFLVRNWLYSQNALIWCIFLEMLEDRADGAEGVSGLVVEGGYADAGAEGRDRRDFGGWARSGSPLCCDRRGSWARCLLPPPWNSRGGGGLRGAGMGSV